MKLTAHSLRQIDPEYILSLDQEALQDLSLRMLADLKEAQERLNQNPDNSSRPPSSRAVWERVSGDQGSAAADDDTAAVESSPTAVATENTPSAEDDPTPSERGESSGDGPAKRRAGKQPGAPGYGRQQWFTADQQQVHRPEVCGGCGRALAADDRGQVYTGFQSVDVDWGEHLGLIVQVIDHRYEEVACGCGHRTRAVAGQGPVDGLLEGVDLSEWRLVGPGLATLIVALNLRFRLSRARIQELLRDVVGLDLSTGTIHATIHEAGAALAPVEEELIAEVLDSEQLHADETPWPQQSHQGSLWLWVFVSTQVTLYYVAGRGRELVDNVLDGFHGWLMSDGWPAYRHYAKRLRCWAHLQRKARGLSQSLHRDAQAFGTTVNDTLKTLIDAVYAAREGPPQDLTITYATSLQALRDSSERHRGHEHKKTHALAVELLNDWDAIIQVLRLPQLPLTNNRAEQALRHWVISRLISHGTRTDTGSRLFALTASVIDTCRQRNASPWLYIRSVITARRAGQPAARLPQKVGV